MRKSDPDELKRLVTEYALAAAAHGEATRAGDSARSNRSYNELAAIYRSLRERGEREQLLPLLESDDPAVRSWAAAHALEFSPERAVSVLNALALNPPSPESLNAQMTLQEWKRGRLRFP